MTLGEKIRAARKAKGMTQKELAAKIKAAHNSISNWENDQNNPDPNTIQHLCWALDVQPNYFLGDDEDSPSPDTVDFDDFTYAMHGFSGELTGENKAALLHMAQQLADANRKKDANGDFN